MKMNTKILAVAVVAMFAVTAFTFVADENDAADKVTYHFYIQCNDETLNATPINKWLDAYEAESQSKDSFIAGLSASLDKADIDYDIGTSGWINSIGEYATHGEWLAEYYGFAIYYADGEEWESTSTYAESTTFAIVFDKYLSSAEYEELTEDEQKNYLDSGWGYATKLPTVSTTGYDNSMMMYIIIAVVVIIIIAAAVFFLKKKNA